jgi:hypothetical protein
VPFDLGKRALFVILLAGPDAVVCGRRLRYAGRCADDQDQLGATGAGGGARSGLAQRFADAALGESMIVANACLSHSCICHPTWSKLYRRVCKAALQVPATAESSSLSPSGRAE